MRLVNKDVWEKVRFPAHTPANRASRSIILVSEMWRLSIFAYSIFLPLRLGTMWFYIGLPIWVSGAIIYAIVWVNFATTPLDQPVTKGLYRYSRHPMHLAPFITLLGTSIVTSSWLLLVFSTVFTVLRCISATSEERAWLEKYGDPYREYMDRTPRWIGIPESAPES
jgi:protein-S-isoprenylcysteine O-methyltransferase Ste14